MAVLAWKLCVRCNHDDHRDVDRWNNFLFGSKGNVWNQCNLYNQITLLRISVNTTTQNIFDFCFDFSCSHVHHGIISGLEWVSIFLLR